VTRLGEYLTQQRAHDAPAFTRATTSVVQAARVVGRDNSTSAPQRRSSPNAIVLRHSDDTRNPLEPSSV
jgi:hypothetical protein